MSAVHGGRLFAIARERGWDWREILDFSASVNPLGPSPLAVEAIQRAACEIAHYPESHPQELTNDLADMWKVHPDQILLGNGATDLIHFLGTIFTNAPVTLCVPVFTEFHRVFPGAAMVPVAEPDQWPESGVTVFTRPVNPTGEVVHCMDWLSRTTHPVIVDESFVDFAITGSLAQCIATRPNLIILRSLTKFYGIPGLRLGALLASPELIACWKKWRDPWSVNVLAIRAGRAAIADREHGSRTLDIVRVERQWLAQELRAFKGVHIFPSAANFLLAHLPHPAAQLRSFLEDRKILIRDCTGWPGIEGSNFVRVAVRTRVDNEQLIAAWKEFICEF